MIRTTNLIASVSRNAGGLFESVRRLVQSLEIVGMDVRVLGLRDVFTDADEAAWRPVVVRTFRPSWPETFGYSPGFLDELRDFKPDITHTHGIWLYPSVATNLYCRNRRLPYMVSAHGMLDPWALRHSRWKKAVARLLYEGTHLHGARCLRALCEPEARAIRQVGLKNEIAIIPNGIDLPASAPGTPPPWEGLIKRGGKVLLYLGRIHPKKGIPNLLKAWAQIQKTGGQGHEAEWVLAIAGWDQSGHEAELKRLAADLGLIVADVRSHPDLRLNAGSSPVRTGIPSVIFLGPQFNEAKAACYHFCDGFVLPSFSEGVPMVVLEAWASSKPVVMTPQCNLPQGFSAGAAVKIDPTSESVAEGLNEFFRLTERERAAMGQRGRDLAAEQFAWLKIAARTREVYEWMLGGGPKPACMTDF